MSTNTTLPGYENARDAIEACLADEMARRRRALEKQGDEEEEDLLMHRRLARFLEPRLRWTCDGDRPELSYTCLSGTTLRVKEFKSDMDRLEELLADEASIPLAIGTDEDLWGFSIEILKDYLKR